MIETIYLVRHGFRLSWETSLWNSPTGTPRDPPLSKYGVDQAKETAKHFVKLFKAESMEKESIRIYSSPLYRCLQTCGPLSEGMELPILVEPGFGYERSYRPERNQITDPISISEWYLPVKRGLHPKSKPSTELQQWFPTISPSLHATILTPPQTGESIQQIHSRAKSVISKLIESVESEELNDEVKVLIIFTHAATNIALGRALVGDESTSLPIRSGCCSIGKYDRQVEGGWEQTLNGDSTHLEKGEERHWEFEYVVRFDFSS